MAFDPAAAAAPGSGIYGLTTTLGESRVVVLPVPVEATTSYGGGASRGPAAVLAASHQVDLFDSSTGRPYEAGIVMVAAPRGVRRLDREARRRARRVIEAGGDATTKRLQKSLRQVNAAGSRINELVYARVRELLDAGKLVCTLGGDHSAPFGAIRAHAERWPGLGILHLDAHADLREAYEGFEWSHASIMYNVVTKIHGVSCVVQVGIRDCSEAELAFAAGSGRVTVFHDALLAGRLFSGESWNSIVKDIVAVLPGEVYLSFDIDGLDPMLCPHTGTPVPGGLSFNQAVALVAGVVESGRRIVGLDLCEVAPGPDDDEWDGNVGARLLYKMIGYALRSLLTPGTAGRRGRR
jgi:agmatinase